MRLDLLVVLDSRESQVRLASLEQLECQALVAFLEALVSKEESRYLSLGFD